jgi:phosphatidylglycerol:prolipoprotein diacylglycerol transferase
MLIYPNFNPVAFSIGGFKIHWYGIMYILGFMFFVVVGKWRVKYYEYKIINAKLIDDMLFYGVLGVIIGGRLGYCLFYQPQFYLTHPFDIVKTWNGGMSFHGGMLGVFVAIYLMAVKHKRNFFEYSDFIAPLIPAALFFGRLGNFINGELWGRITTATIPWAMIFPQSGSMLPRHPSQLYEALFEGVLLLIILWVYAHKQRKVGQISGVFMIGYGIIRFLLENFREPDSFLLSVPQHTGLTMGQWLCLPMILAGIIIYVLAATNRIIRNAK